MPNATTLSPLLTDLYQLTMAYGYWRAGRADQEAVFHLFFRKAPFGSGYTIAAGLADAIAWLEALRFSEDDVAYLATLTGNDDRPLFDAAFLAYLRELRFTCDVDAIPEGTVVFPHEPLVRIRGPILQGQLAETALLNIVNFQTLIATKAARVCQATEGEPVLEFGLRRAQGTDGALTASRAAFIGGCAATSNVLAGRLFGIPVKGTHAHSWVMSFDDEPETFEAYAAAMPNNCVFLVDTYDTVAGVRHAIEAGRRLRERGHRLVGVRLDSGDLAYLSIEARRLLDEAGFTDAVIFASNDLDEHIIASLKQQGVCIGLWGVGTKLVTAYDQPALGGVYKLGAIRDAAGVWHHKIKLSEQPIKVSNPGILQVRRFVRKNAFIGDMLFDETATLDGAGDATTATYAAPDAPEGTLATILDPGHPGRRKHFPTGTEYHDLLVPIFRHGALVYAEPTLPEIRAHAATQLAALHPGTRRLLNPHDYPVGLAPDLHETKHALMCGIKAAR